jgi:lysyl-tRNA synthetase class 1
MSWPFEEAKRLLNRIQGKTPAKGYVLFKTGYSPSGLPHIGTFGEVARTTMVRHAFSQLCDIPTKLLAFSDDIDGLRKVPDNIPNDYILRENLHKPLTKIPDPFQTHESFGHHNNAMLRRFLDSFDFEYEFQSSSKCYQDGFFDEALLRVAHHYDEIMAIMLPFLREERQKTYSPFLPICPKTGFVLQVPILECKKDHVVYKDPNDGEIMTVPVTGGNCKLQWKVDWGMQWYAFGVDYEMAGKDHIENIRLSSKICTTIGGKPPETLTYELFLDDQGKKISKSKGNGLTIDEWLTYAPCESLALYMYTAPKRAKRLYFDVIPKCVDEYLAFLEKFHHQSLEEKLENPVYHIHQSTPPLYQDGISFNILLNLASACHAKDSSLLWQFVKKYNPNLSPQSHTFLDRLITYAISYYRDFVEPKKHHREPNAQEHEAINNLKNALLNLGEEASGESIQQIIFAVGKEHAFVDLKKWFGALYEVLLGQKEGPRMGTFIKIYGVRNMVALIDEKIKDFPKK